MNQSHKRSASEAGDWEGASLFAAKPIISRQLSKFRRLYSSVVTAASELQQIHKIRRTLSSYVQRLVSERRLLRLLSASIANFPELNILALRPAEKRKEHGRIGELSLENNHDDGSKSLTAIGVMLCRSNSDLENKLVESQLSIEVQNHVDVPSRAASDQNLGDASRLDALQHSCMKQDRSSGIEQFVPLHCECRGVLSRTAQDTGTEEDIIYMQNKVDESQSLINDFEALVKLCKQEIVQYKDELLESSAVHEVEVKQLRDTIHRLSEEFDILQTSIFTKDTELIECSKKICALEETLQFERLAHTEEITRLSCLSRPLHNLSSSSSPRPHASSSSSGCGP